LGTHPGYHPTYRGFDASLTVPYSVDMGCLGPNHGPYYNLPQPKPCATGANTAPASSGQPALPLYNATRECGGVPADGGGNCNAQIAQQPLAENELDSNYANYLGSYIAAHGASSGAPPFFAYMAFSHTHVPLFYDPKFANSSARKTVFADTTMELDDTVARIVASVRAAGIENDTLIIATADNGPWAVKCDLAGSPGPYVGAHQARLGGGSSLKDTTWEGGQRVFGLAAWPGKIAPAVSHATASSLDLLPTILALAGVPLPTDRSYDGVDLAPVLFDGAASVRDFLFMDDTIGGQENVTAVRYKNFKAYTRTYSMPSCTEPEAKPVDHPDYLVFDLDADPGETTPVRPPAAVMDAIWKAHNALLADIASTFRSQVNWTSGNMVNAAPCCNPANAACRCDPINVAGDVDAA
jgi:arylsulfatase G